MIQTKQLELAFSEFIPKEIEQGILYVSMEYGTVIHLCACGCGEKVITPLGRREWQLQYDGESITLTPSIGNWNFPCKSHYWIRHSNVVWAESWEDFQRQNSQPVNTSQEEIKRQSFSISGWFMTALKAIVSQFKRKK